jgi:hypothetical protein
VKRRLYVSPASGSLEDCSARPSSWDSSFCVVLRGNEELWQRYLDAERICDEARHAVLEATTKEPMTAEELALYARAHVLYSTCDLDSSEWMSRCDEIEAEARRLAEGDTGASVSVNDEGVAL